MEIFYSNKIKDDELFLSEGESNHCIRVLRNRVGDEVMVSGGDGNLYRCMITDDDPRRAVLKIESVEGSFGAHPYQLHIAIAPTKNIDRFEWFLEKATEIGVDEITPLLCDHSERKVIKSEREERVILAAAKQSLKGTVPQFNEMCTAAELISSAVEYDLKAIAFCDRELVNSMGVASERRHIMSVIGEVKAKKPSPKILVLIGPEGDFSRDELVAAADAGFVPVSLGDSRLRTETAGVMVASAVALNF